MGFWIGDPTAIWFAQVVHGEPRLIDYYEASGVGLEHCVAQLRAGPRAHWVYGQHFSRTISASRSGFGLQPRRCAARLRPLADGPAGLQRR